MAAPARRDHYIDLRGEFAACGDDRACEPLPVERWVRTDFLWQRSPFLLLGGSRGTIEGAGIDFLLPYWMARKWGNKMAGRASLDHGEAGCIRRSIKRWPNVIKVIVLLTRSDEAMHGPFNGVCELTDA